jgi:type II secretory pathway pseudopilin PulG
MLTVIAIIGILAAILIPTVQVAMKKARMVTASADISHLYQAATAYNLDFGAFPPDCTAFWSPQDNPFPGSWNSQNTTPLCPNELLVWHLTMQYSTGQYNTATASYPATGYPAGWPVPPATDALGDWTPSSASTVFSRVNCGPYFDMKANQKTDVNANGYYEFMDPWRRPYMYRAYPQAALVTGAGTPSQANSSAPWTVTLTLGNLSGYNGYNFYMNANLANSVGTIQLSGFTNNNYNGTFMFTGASSSAVNLMFPSTTNPGTTNQLYAGCYGTYTFPLHNPQTCDIYSLGPYGLTRAAYMPQNSSNTSPQEWKPTHGGGGSLDFTSLDAWPQVWGTPGDGNDINLASGNAVVRNSAGGNIIVNVLYQDNICNWN